MIRLVLVLAAARVLFLPCSTLADAHLRNAETLYAAGAFEAAEGEYRLHLLSEPGSTVALFRAAQSAMGQAKYRVAASDFARVRESGTGLAGRASFLVGLANYRLLDYSSAWMEWGELVRWVEDDDLVAAAQYGRVWCAIHGHDWPSAQAELARTRSLFPGRELDDRQKELAEALRGAEALPLRSPGAAKWVSTGLPGAGQIYSGRVVNGVVSAGINGAFLYFLGRSVAGGRWVDAVFIYLGGSRFYWGGRQNAERFARERNKDTREAFVARLAQYDF